MSVKKGIVVELYRDVRSTAQDVQDISEYQIHFENYGQDFTAEQLILAACKKMKIGPSGFYIFGLLEAGKCGKWLPPNKTIECTDIELKEYLLRVRFIPSLTAIQVLGKESKEALNYFFLQCRDDFVQDKIVLKKNVGQECVLGLGVLDMLRWGKENQYDLAFLKREEPRKFIPGSSKKLFRSFWDKSKLKSNVNSELEKLFLATNAPVAEYKIRYINGFINYCLQYGIEKFKTVHNETVVVDPQHDDFSGIYLQKDKGDQSAEICSIRDVMFINKGRLSENWQVTVSRKHGGTPKTLVFGEECDAEAFISLVDGYHRLVDDFHYQVCPEISSPMVEQLARIKSHGPVSKPWAVKRLEKKHSVQPEFNFLLMQHGSEFDCYIILFIPPPPKSAMKTLIISRNEQGQWHFKKEEEPKFPTIVDLLQHFAKNDRKVLLRYVPPTSPMDNIIFLCRKNIKDEDADEGPKHEMKSQASLISGISDKLVQGTGAGDGQFTVLHKVLWDKNPNDLQRVAVKQLKPQYSPQYLEELMEGIHRATFWRCPTLVNVQAISLHPFQVVLEHAEHGNLETYMQEKPVSDLECVSIADQVAQALMYIHESVHEESGLNCGFHGNIRSRNVLVFNTGSQSSSIKVKLGDPGMVALYNKLPLDHVINEERLPWIAPELYSPAVNLTANNHNSDIYSYGVFMWEIFSGGERPFENLNIKQILRTVLYKCGLEPPDDCYKGVGEIISRCLQKNIEKRPSVKEIVRDLGKVMHDYTGNTYNMATYGRPLYSIQNDDQEATAISESEQDSVINSIVRFAPEMGQPPAASPSSPLSPVSVISHSPGSFFHCYDSKVPLLPQASVESNPSVPQFSNTELKKFIFDTKDNVIIQASRDRFWGVGKTLRDKDLWVEEKWSGKNIMGKALMERRESETATTSGVSQTTMTTEVSFGEPASPTSPVTIQHRPLPPTPNPVIPLSELKHIVHPDRLHIESKVLGKGHYGQVHRALFTLTSGKKQTVAVKSLNAAMYNRFHNEFDKECKMMTQLEHPNIVQIIGQCFEKENHATLLVMEFVQRGSLRDFIHEGVATANKENRIEQYYQHMLPKLLKYSLEIAEGMIYLSERKIVHRDLASRNVLVTDEEIMKISDFGLARNLNPEKNYYSMSDRSQEIPLFWCAPESMEPRKFSTASDVWSYGVTLWELYTFGKLPRLCKVESLFYVLTILNKRLPKPAKCPGQIYNYIMFKCWHLEPEQRITFPAIAKAFQDYASESVEVMESTNPFTPEPSVTVAKLPRIPTENNEARESSASSEHLQEMLNNRVTSIDVSQTPLPNPSQSSEHSMSLPPPLQVSKPSTKGIVNMGLVQDRSLPDLPSDSDHHLFPDLLSIAWDKFLGKGHYGEVCEGHYKNKKIAVKILKSQMYEKYWQEFDGECKMMAKLSHPHIVKHIGQCSKTVRNAKQEFKEQLVLVMEYVEKGSLKAFLREQKSTASKQGRENLVSILGKRIPQLIQFMAEIAQGMAYLHSVNVVHRDLAARNVLVTADDHMKISDFGLARTLGGDKDYYKMASQTEGIPAYWCAPEALDHRKFSNKTDVWSFGVTAWEIMTFGKEPELCKCEVLSRVLIEGRRLPKPELCDSHIYSLMNRCWEKESKDRPEFDDVIMLVDEIRTGLS